MNLDDGNFAAETSEPATAIYGDVRLAVTANQVHQIGDRYYGSLTRMSSLNKDALKRLQDMFVQPPGWDEAWARLRDRQVVALTADSGSGRRTTAINLLASQGLPVKELLVAEDNDLDRHFSADAGCGYILTLPAVREIRMPGLVNKYLQQVVEAGSSLVIIATPANLRDLDRELQDLSVLIQPANARDVFGKIIEKSYDIDTANHWLRFSEIQDRLRGATLEDACRLASLVVAVLASQHEDPLSEVLGAHANWLDELKAWEQEIEDRENEARDRATVLAIAALEGSSPAAVFEAASQLMDVAGLESPRGAALAGPGIDQRLQRVHARVDDQRVTFNRVGYGRSLLDRTWTDRPDLQKVIARWLKGIQAKTFTGEDIERAGQTLLNLADRQCDASPVLDLAQEWVRTDRMASAARLVSEAATSSSIGRATRKRLYDWSKLSNIDNRIHFLVAEVCSGDMALSYPEVALTRLRHLANRDDDLVRQEVVTKVHHMASHGVMKFALEREVIEWTGAAESLRARCGRKAFLALAREWEPNSMTPLMVARVSPSIDATEVLGNGWRAVLLDATTRAKARETAWGWLDAANEGRAPQELIVNTFARASRTTGDAAVVSKMVLDWPGNTRNVVPGYEELQLQIIKLIHRNDGLAFVPGITGGSGGEHS
ncbi:hypothetical protein LWF15_32930 [Kineosporia rhizophila]|uniref:hypothetical protein n=1 Tax=Kineosporia TaxID=49184 RepID=UPI000A562272|nr:MULTISPECIES: hypothetical protein [Kineosporia]MCE0540309.1 hypothetical protein [Kineosporia rhizophila]GLY16324.1 hypothetical protein Kisp01_33390 [Kineosporia sp. NBRC 101677]